MTQKLSPLRGAVPPPRPGAGEPASPAIDVSQELRQFEQAGPEFSAPPAPEPVSSKPAAAASSAPSAESSPAQDSPSGSVTILTFDELAEAQELMAAEARMSPPPPPTQHATPPHSPKYPAPPSAPASVHADAAASKAKPRNSRAQRVPLAVPILVRAPLGAASALREETRTVQVLSRGAVFTLKAAAHLGESFVLINLRSGKEVPCSVVDLQHDNAGKVLVEVEFNHAVAEFWPVSFPGEQSGSEGRPRTLDAAKQSEAAKITLPPSAKPPLETASIPPVSVSPAPSSMTKPPLEFLQGTPENASLVTSPVAKPSTPASERKATPSLPPPVRPAPSNPAPAAELVDLTALVLADEPAASREKPASGHSGPAIAPPLISLPAVREPAAPSARAKPSALEAPVMPADYAPLGRMSDSGASPTKRNYSVVAVAALLVVAAIGGYWLYHRSASSRVKSAAAQGEVPAVTQPATPAVTPSTAPGNEPIAQGAFTPAPPAAAAPSAPSKQTSLPAAHAAPQSTAAENAKNQPSKPAPREANTPPAPAASRPAEKLKLPAAKPSAPIAVAGNAPREVAPPPELSGGLPGGASTAILPASSMKISSPQPAAPQGGGVQVARLLTPIVPEYPPIARKARVQDDVVIRADIDATGKVTRVSVVSGHAMLQEAAKDAVRTSKFAPARLNGEPIASQMLITVRFKL